MIEVFIGIDPGKNNGVAIWSVTGKKYLSLETLDFWDVLNQLDDCKKKYVVHSVVIENPNLNKPVFMDSKQKSTVTNAFNNMRKYARRQDDLFDQYKDVVLSENRILATKAQRVGMNKQYSKLLIEYCNRIGLKINEIRPYLSKLNAKEFAALTKWEGRTNEHNRDAARLVYRLEKIS